MGNCKQTVAAVVVTYNRIKLLKECIQSIRTQTRIPDEVIIVNNNSTDGTLEWLNEQKDLTVITQQNLGGAGGFHTGIKIAYENNIDWVWCMDDDGYADKNALTYLFSTNKFFIRNSLVIDQDGIKLSFPLYDYENKVLYNYTNQVFSKDYIFGGNFFNGTMIHKTVFEQIGYPNKKFFIRGDEVEYYLRILNYGIKIITIPTSKFYHKYDKIISLKFKSFYQEYNFMNSTKRFYYSRNIIYLHKLYPSIIRKRYLIRTFLLDLILNLLFLDFRGNYQMLRGIKNGLLTKREDL